MNGLNARLHVQSTMLRLKGSSCLVLIPSRPRFLSTMPHYMICTPPPDGRVALHVHTPIHHHPTWHLLTIANTVVNAFSRSC